MQKSKKSAKGPPAAQVPQQIITYLTALEPSVNHDKKFQGIIFSVFDKQENPLHFALDLASYTKFYKKGKPGRFPSAILEALKIWCKTKNISHMLTRKQKVEALDIALQLSSGHAIKLVCEIFELHDEKEYVTHMAHHLLANQRFKEAFHIISALDIENEFPIEQCLFPLFFIGHEAWVKLYLTKCPHMQLQFVKTLDSLCQSFRAIQDFLKCLNLEGLKPNNCVIDKKWILRRLPLYIDLFNIDIRHCPNLYRSRSGGAMSYLFRKRFMEESIEYEPWEEMMIDTIADHPNLQNELLMKLVCIGEYDVAFRIAECLKISRKNWPEVLRTMPCTAQESRPIPVNMNPTNPEDYLSLRLNKSDIFLVNTPSKLVKAVNDISENYDVVGVDAEWKPNLGISKEKSALLQLSVWDAVYLVDIIALQNSGMQNIWDPMLKRLFFNEGILKLGYGIENDLKVLMKTINYEKIVDGCKYPRLIDLGTFFKKLKMHYPEIDEEIEKWHPISTDDNPDIKGLSQVCRIVLGKPLNKGEQFSNWERRPLRDSQIIYAALDSYCLLMIYEKLYILLKNADLDLEKVLVSTKTPVKAEKPKVESVQEPLPVSKFKVIVDSTVGGVAKYLRLLGADVKCLAEGDDHMCAVQIAQKENRIIVTTKELHKKMIGYVPAERCYCIIPDLKPKLQVVRILEQFNVECNDSDIFSRCTACNGNQYLKVQNEELFNHWSSYIGTETNQNIGRKNSTTYMCDVTDLDGNFHKGLPIQLASFSSQVFQHKELFFICNGCGKVYWDGSHLSRLKESVAKMINIKVSNRSVYKDLLEGSSQLNDETLKCD